MNRFALVALASVPLVLAACDVETKNPAAEGNRVSMSADANGQVSFDLPFARGEVKLPASMMENSNFDLDGVKLMPGAQITGFNLDANDGPAEVRLTFSAPVTPEEAQRYFVDEFAAKGVEAAMAGGALSGVSKDGTPFVIRFAPAGSGTNGTIELRPKDGSSN